MKNKKLIISMSVAILAFGIVAYASNAGTSEDPLVTKSYIDGIVTNLKTYIDNKVAGGSDEGGAEYQTFELESGKTLIAGQGAEIILRSGKATIIATERGGIADVTDGRDLVSGVAMPQNHQLIVPIADGRGFKTTASCWVMVKGGYEIK